MDAFASPSIQPGPAGKGGWRAVEAVLATLVLAASFFAAPVPASPNLDLSWQAMLVHAHAEGLQFGRDIIFSWGPWGFLCSRAHLGSVEAVPLLAWQVVGQLLIAAALVALTRALPAWRRRVFVAALVAVQWLFQDTVYFVLIALILLAGLLRPDAGAARLAAWTLILGFLAQIKFTYFILASAAALAAAVCWSARGSKGRAWAVAGGYAVGFLAAWVAAGQDLDNVYPYLRRSLEISSGYADAMGVDEPWGVFLWGCALAAACALFVRSVWRTVGERPLAVCAAGYLALSFFIMWKESFIRADMIPLGGHVFGLVTYVLILAPAATGLLFPARRWHGFDASVALCLLGIASLDPAFFRLAPRVCWERVYGAFDSLLHLGSLPAAWQGQFEEASRRASLPRIRAAVANGTVDVYNDSMGTALLNGMRISSRPIFQSYCAYTPGLEEWNLRFYQSARAPDFLLWDGGNVDGRYPAQDDARLVAALPGHYEPVLSEDGYWLFRKLAPLSNPPAGRDVLLQRRVGLSQEVELPLLALQAIWLKADASPNAMGRVRSLLYKPAQLNIATTDFDGQRRVWRLLPRVARDGFILAPMLATGADMAALMRGDALTWVRSFHFEAPEGQGEFWGHVDVELSGMPNIPFHSPSPVGWLIGLGIFDRPPLSITSQLPLEAVKVPGDAMLLHAEGEVVFAVPRGAARFSGSFGIREGAYSGGGQTRGVEFSVEAQWPSGRRERLWDRFLDPVARPSDRGSQSLDVRLPSETPSRLLLHTGAGPDHDNRWDWSYVSELRFDVPPRE